MVHVRERRAAQGVWVRRLAAVVLTACAVWLVGCGSGNADDFIWGRQPSFTPDGLQVIYAQNLSAPSEQVTSVITDLDAGTIWRINVAGGAPTRLTPLDRGPDFLPAVSPDGAQIAFVTSENDQFDLWVMDTNGGNRRQITFDPATDTTPTWTPDGQRVVFVSDRSGNADLWSVGVDGTGLTQLTTFPSDESAPDVSVAGEIAFSSNRDRGNFDIWVMDASGGNLRQLTAKAEAETKVADGGPAWSPDGTRIAFERWDDDWNIFAMQADGTQMTQLTTDDDHDGDPAWSPDGATLAFTSSRSGWWQVWLMAANGNNQRRLTGNQ